MVLDIPLPGYYLVLTGQMRGGAFITSSISELVQTPMVLEHHIVTYYLI